jgi:hypothetical protein
MFADAPAAEALAFARVLSTGAYRRAVEAIDAAAGRTLSLLAEAGMVAFEAAAARAWIPVGDEVAQARLLWFAFEPDKELGARRDRLRMAYATAQEPTLAELLAKEKPARTELVLLAFTGERARDFGYVTHLEWATQRAAELIARADRLRAAIFWQRAARVLAAAPGLLGRWPAFLLVWAAPLALAGAGGSWVWAVGLAMFAVGLRGMARAALNTGIVQHDPSAPRWSWRDGPARAVRNAAASRDALPPAQRANPLADLTGIQAELRQLALKDLVVPPAPSRLAGFWAASIVANLVPLAFCILPWIGVDFSPRPTPPEIVRRAPARAPEATMRDGAIFEDYDDGFGQRKRGPLRAWDVVATTPEPMTVTEARSASAMQRAYARVGAELLLEPYPRKDLKISLAVPVPGNGRWAVVLYDTERRELVDRRAFFLTGAPEEKRWYWLGNRRVVYLGPPPRLPALQNSLAQP